MPANRRQFIQTAGALSLGVAPPISTAAQSHSTGSSSAAPNVLLLFPDQHRYDWIGATPNVPVRTPHLDALAARGVRFQNAVCPSPLCAPSRACLASGKEYPRCGTPNNGADYPLEQTTFYQLLRESGYFVAGCGKFDLHKASPIWGLDGRGRLLEWGFDDGIDNAGKWDAIRTGSEAPHDPYMAYLHDQGLVDLHVGDFTRRRNEGGSYGATFPTPLPEPAYCDNWIAENGLNLLRRMPSGKPWFLQVNYAGPHDPVDVTNRMHDWYREANFPPPVHNTKFDEETHQNIRRNYSAMVENIDRWTGTFIQELERRGELDNTLILYSSDHGEMLGDHDLWAKTQPFHPSACVPLVIAGPGVSGDRVVSNPSATLDIAATILDYAGLEIPADMDSRSLKPVLRGDADSVRDHVLSGLNPWRMVFDGRYKLVLNYGKSKETLLFDLLNDPQELENRAKDDPRRVKELSGLIG
ncbi:MAG: sulfatase-like hydrolase/transferase [bacterium]|nr:sulfatase-like hydrolase/transferase [bacterium]